MQVARSDMSDLEWEFIKAVLPNKTRGKKRVDDRRVINGIFYVLRTGIPWADLPFLIVFRDNPVARATDRMLRPSTSTHRRIFDTLSINNTCSFLCTILRGC